ncbi:PREDICTED: uncharacterized protein LOC104609915 [Nelumbo nucifera]|uniref:Uncharacterized protein LOC104609915 n=1 Tax=Nelumbo nucifera TaxID=4432 RepID=A0A1U8B5D6_NELNU|nr:PREDICTED: uncharacterized protein LOC104609915 [Nelumbo nucifera]
MSLSSVILVGPTLPVTGSRYTHIRRSSQTVVEKALPLQVRCKAIQEQRSVDLTMLTASRRDAMICMTTTFLAGITLFATEPVEARVQKQENRRKIREKLDMLREKAGLSKSKTKDRDSKEEEKMPSPPPKEKILVPPLPPKPQDTPNAPLVEATISK